MSSLTPETVVLHNNTYQVVGRFYGEPEMVAIPCFPQQADVLPIRTQLDPKTPLKIVGFDGEFYTFQPVREVESRFWQRRRFEPDYKPHGSTVLVHKNFLKFLILVKKGW